jgi:hypothetical protein
LIFLLQFYELFFVAIFLKLLFIVLLTLFEDIDELFLFFNQSMVSLYFIVHFFDDCCNLPEQRFVTSAFEL